MINNSINVQILLTEKVLIYIISLLKCTKGKI